VDLSTTPLPILRHTLHFCTRWISETVWFVLQPLMSQMILSNLWLLSGAVSSVLSASYETDAIQRTTTAVTMFNAGVKENVMPSSAEVIILLLVDSRDFWHRRSSTTGFIRQRRWKMLWSMIGPVFVLCHNDLGSKQGGDRWQQSGDIQKPDSFDPPPISPYGNDIIAHSCAIFLI